jgi:hypothetical protein
VIRPGRASPLVGVVIYGRSGPGGVRDDVVLSDLPDERLAGEEVVDQFLAAPVDAAESLFVFGGDARGEVCARVVSRVR